MSSPQNAPEPCPHGLRSTVPPAADGLALLDWLVRRFRYFDADGWSAQIAAGRVHVGTAAAGNATVVRTGDTIAFFPQVQRDAAAEVQVLFADADLVVVDKPPFLVVQSVGAFVRHTFVRGLSAQFPPEPPRQWLEPVHRLDRETSGVLVLARSDRAARGLQRQFEAAAVAKEYIALVHGVVAGDSLRIEAPIGPDADSAIDARRAVVAAGSRGARAATTLATVERRFAAHTLVRVQPLTGRTHQIRVHMEHVGHPLVGDKLYGHPDAHWLAYTAHLKADGDPRWPGRAAVPRQMLHAASLRCVHPGTGETIAFAAPWPDDFAAAVSAAAAPARSSSSPASGAAPA